MESTWQNYHFPTTRWSLISRVREDNDQASLKALNEIYEIYWLPLYAIARFKKWSPQDAEDLVQGFLSGLKESVFFENVDREKGAMRNYLRKSFEHYLFGEVKKRGRLKRGGNQVILSIDREMAEQTLGPLEENGMDLTSLYDRQWALALLRRVLVILRESYASRGQEETFEALQSYVSLEADEETTKAIAEKLGKTEMAVRQAIVRLRSRYKDALIDEIHQTVGDEVAAEGELAYLTGIFGSR